LLSKGVYIIQTRKKNRKSWDFYCVSGLICSHVYSLEGVSELRGEKKGRRKASGKGWDMGDGREGTLSPAIDTLEVCSPACLTAASELVVLQKRMMMTYSMHVGRVVKTVSPDLRLAAPRFYLGYD